MNTSNSSNASVRGLFVVSRYSYAHFGSRNISRSTVAFGAQGWVGEQERVRGRRYRKIQRESVCVCMIYIYISYIQIERQLLCVRYREIYKTREGKRQQRGYSWRRGQGGGYMQIVSEILLFGYIFVELHFLIEVHVLCLKGGKILFRDKPNT